MDGTITEAVANRPFSKILGAVREGASDVVTSPGKPVVRIVPCGTDIDTDMPHRRRWRHEAS